MGKKANQFKTDLIRRIQEYPDGLISETQSMDDVTITKPLKTEKKFSKKEIIDLITNTYNHLLK